MDGPYEVSGGFVRYFLKTINDMGLTQKARLFASPEGNSLIDDPPSLWHWTDALWVSSLMAAVGAAYGADVLRDTGQRCCHESLGPIAMPLLRVVHTLSGASPAAFYGEMGKLTRPFQRGITFNCSESGPKHVMLDIRIPAPEMFELFPFWEGVLRFTMDFTRMKGRILPTLPYRGSEAKFRIEWN